MDENKDTGTATSTNSSREPVQFKSMSDVQIVQAFLKNKLKPDAVENNTQLLDLGIDYASVVLNAFLHVPLYRFPQLLVDIPCRDSLIAADIPQFSNLETAMYYIPKLLIENESLTYRELGMRIYPCKSIGAAAKYGENHAKLTVGLGLAKTTKKSGQIYIIKTDLTGLFCELPQSDKSDVLQKLCFRLPIVQEAARKKEWRIALKENLSFLTDSMVQRRMHCCVELISFALGE